MGQINITVLLVDTELKDILLSATLITSGVAQARALASKWRAMLFRALAKPHQETQQPTRK